MQMYKKLTKSKINRDCLFVQILNWKQHFHKLMKGSRKHPTKRKLGLI